MKKIALAMATLLIMSACSNNSESQSQTANTTNSPVQATAQQERKAEHYVIGVDATSPPFLFKDEYGQAMGFEIDILRAIAEDQDFSFEPLPTDHSNVLSGVTEGRYQIGSGALAMSPQRQTIFETTVPTLYAPNIIMGKEGSTAQRLYEIGDQSVAIEGGTAMEDILTQVGTKNIVYKDSLYAAYGAFIRGEADYVIGDAAILGYHHANSGVADKVKTYSAVFDPDDTDFVFVGFLTQKGNTALRDKLNAGLANIRANGKYDEIYKTWFGDDKTLLVPAERLQPQEQPQPQ